MVCGTKTKQDIYKTYVDNMTSMNIYVNLCAWLLKQSLVSGFSFQISGMGCDHVATIKYDMAPLSNDGTRWP